MNKNANPYYFGMRVINDTKLKKTESVAIYDYTEDNIKYFLSRGYVIKAKSAFRNTFIHMSWAELAAKQMGSNVVLCKREYVGTSSGTSVIPWYVPGETYTVNSKTSGSVSANGYANSVVIGSNGYAVGSSSSSAYGTYNSNTTTTIQSPDRYDYYSVPYSYNYYDQYAVFLVKEQDIQDILDAKNKVVKNKKIEIGATYNLYPGIELFTEPISNVSYLKYTSKAGDDVNIIEKTNDYYKVEYKGEILYLKHFQNFWQYKSKI
jgi:hypothetical protein